MFENDFCYSGVQRLDSADFEDTDSLRMAAGKTRDPVLLIVKQSELPDVLSWIAEKDDVCLDNDPQDLVKYRLQSLAREIEGLRDPLTSLLNRQRFEQLLNDATMEADFNRPVSLLALDLDFFKMVNDQYGHTVGDDVLRTVAALLRAKQKECRAISRVGGEEFSVLLDADESQAVEFAESFRSLVEQTPIVDGLKITTSIGMTTVHSPTEGGIVQDQVSQALYSAKDRGRNCSVSFSQVVAQSRKNGQAVDVLSLENQARVLAQRVANVITMRSKSILNTARREADVDGLTGCFTRRYLDRRFADEFETREGTELSIAFFDLDHFGNVNKDFGWPTGDKVLVEVCELVRQRIRDTDWIGRYGGEEFCVVMPGVGLETAKAVMERVRIVVEQAKFVSVDDRPVPMTLSIGLASAVAEDTGFAMLMDRACSFALDAKNNGRNQLCWVS